MVSSPQLEVVHDGTSAGPKDPTHCRGAKLGPGGDLALTGDLAVQLCGNDNGDLHDDGFVVLDVSEPERPVRVGRFRCTASASDLAVYGHLVFLAVDRNFEQGRYSGPSDESCKKKQQIEPDPPLPGPVEGDDGSRPWRGFHVVDISNPAAPRLVHSQGKAGGPISHTLTVIPDLENAGTVLIYSSNPSNRAASQGSFVFRMSLDLPWGRKDKITGPWPLRLERDGEAPPLATGCHDMTFLLPKGQGVCTNVDDGSFLINLQGRLEQRSKFPPTTGFDKETVFVHEVLATLPTLAGSVRHHSSAFSHDGRTLVISNESFRTVGTPACDPSPQNWSGGGLLFYDLSSLVGEVLLPVGYQPPPLVVADGPGWCSSTNLNVVPTRNGHKVLVAGWYTGGTSVIGFDDARRPVELAHYAPDQAMSRGSYWYRGHVYVANLHGCFVQVPPDPSPGTLNGLPRAKVCFGHEQRGIDVLRLDELVDEFPQAEFDVGRQRCAYTAGKHEQLGWDCVT